jgi:hypothetical protein
VQRIETDDADQRMPPSDSGLTITDDQIATLRRWVADGAKYEKHWAYVPPQRPAIPTVRDTSWPRNPIDFFVLARLERENLRPSPPADRYTLVRRVYLDLIGLPPTPEEADAFVRSADPNAYETLVGRLLQSERYGERWGRLWLDLARYSDTNGYEKDRERSIWPYRDWVIDALNADMPFDQFTVEQIAGDMLPNATREQRIATGFHRNTMLNEEGGIDPLEYRFYAMIDRVATTGTVWLGMTVGCAQCHAHKYDPMSQTDYYRLLGLLNNADEPDLIVESDADRERRATLEKQIARLERELPTHFPVADEEDDKGPLRKKRFDERLQAWITQQQESAVDWKVLKMGEWRTNLPKLESLPDNSILSTGDITKRDEFHLQFSLPKSDRPYTALRLEVLPDDRLPARGPGRAFYEGRKGDFFLSRIEARVDGAAAALKDASASFAKISIGRGADPKNVLDEDDSTGWSTATREGQPHQLVVNFAEPIAGERLNVMMLFERHFAASLGRFRWSIGSADRTISASQTPVEVEWILARPQEDWNADEQRRVAHQFALQSSELAEARKPIEKLRAALPRSATTMVMLERPADNPRPTHRHHRGEYLQPKEEVAPGVPAIFPALAGGSKNRLAFARWLVSEKNPLVGRVTVNRAWRAFFGRGLVVTSADFGTQSSPPSHPQLVDWLAVEFMQNQSWSLKQLHRTIVLSATYRQSSSVTPEMLQRDANNVLLSRGPRHRVDAEVVRDVMLRASGKLSSKMGGPSVRPPQPASVTQLAYGNTKWPVAVGEDRYRRSIYTFNKRTAPFAAFTVFDGPTGENCIARRDRSNTPLQALTLLNDAMYYELARALAKRSLEQVDSAPARLTVMFRHLLTRPPTAEELAALHLFYERQMKRLQQGGLDAKKICQSPDATNEWAACSLVARAMMNVDETITKQ